MQPRDVTAPRRGRPKGQTNAPGHAAGRPSQQTASVGARYAHWRVWWATRPNGQPKAAALAVRLAQPASTVRAAANGTRPPNERLLLNLESLSRAYGYHPLSIEQ